MRALKKERLSQTVSDAIKEIIITEELKPGDKLYSENQLTKKLEVSRSSIREAVRILEVTGYVEVHQGKGIFVKDRADMIPSISEWVVNNIELLQEHFEIRLYLEPPAASIAAKNATAKELKLLEETYTLFCADVESQKIAQAISRDSDFHLVIAQITHNRTLSILMKTMAKSLNEGWIASLNTPGRLEHTVVEHGEILTAIVAHDESAAAQKMRIHLSNAIEDMRSYVKNR